MAGRRLNNAASHQLMDAIERLNGTLVRLPRDYPHVFNVGRNLLLNFFRGVFYGLGIIVAFAIVVPFLMSLLQSVEWAPLVGDFVRDVIERVGEVRRL